MTSPPRLEARSDRAEQTYPLWGSFQIGGPAEKADPQVRVPADVVPSAQLVLEESGKQQALRTCRFHHRAIVPQARVEHEMVEHLSEARRRRQIGRRVRGDPGVMREHTGVVQQFLVINGGFRHFLQTHNEKLERLLLPGCK